MEKEKIPLLAWAILIFLAVVWGSSFILIKRAVLNLNPIHVASLRVFVASLLFTPFVFKALKSIEIKMLPKFLLAGLAGNLIPSFLFAISMPYTESTLSGMLNSLSPVFTLITGYLIWKHGFSNIKIWGVFVGLIGCLLLIFFKSDAGNINFNINKYALLIVFATFLYGLNVNLLKVFFQKLNPFYVAVLSLFSVGPIAAFVFFYTGGWDAIWLSEASKVSTYYTITLAVFSSALSLVLFMKLIQMTSPIFSASVTYLIPIVAIIWGVLDGENTSVLQFAGMSVILFGIFLVRK